jgi:hypothetical protein
MPQVDQSLENSEREALTRKVTADEGKNFHALEQMIGASGEQQFEAGHLGNLATKVIDEGSVCSHWYDV